MPASTTALTTRRGRSTVALLALLLGAATACGGDGSTAGNGSPTGSAGSSSSAVAPSGAAAPTSAAPPAPGAPEAPGAGATTVVADGLSVQVPAGWQSTSLTADAVAAALARESDPRVAEFLRGRLDGLAAQGAVLYLYDLRGVANGTLATGEVYRYPAGRTPQDALDLVVLPGLQRAGFSPVRGQTDLPAGTALTLTTRSQAAGKDLQNEFYVLPLGPTAVGLSVTTVGPARADVAQLPQGLAAA